MNKKIKLSFYQVIYLDEQKNIIKANIFNDMKPTKPQASEILRNEGRNVSKVLDITKDTQEIQVPLETLMQYLNA